jgi:alanyl-tRNA synthetase
MFEVYKMQRIQASVRRVDPVTGQKVNKLRKSYEGKLKELNLDGRNKATESQKELGPDLSQRKHSLAGADAWR